MSWDDNIGLNEAIEKVWNALREACKRYQKSDAALRFHEEKFEDFRSKFKTVYASIMKAYMRPNVQELDRHKVIAVLIVASVETGVITHSNVGSKKVFLGQYMIATEIGLSWMREKLNEELREINANCEIDKYTMPEAFACKTPYFEIFCRNLYYAEANGYKLNPLDISEKLFLLEYITLLDNHVDPTTLRSEEE